MHGKSIIEDEFYFLFSLMSIQYLDIQETLPYLGDFLQNEEILRPSTLTSNMNHDDPPTNTDQQVAQDDHPLCQNPQCQYLHRKNELRLLYIYEISSERSVIICDRCYDAGYRFCLFTHEVLHISHLEPVLDQYYA